MSASIKIPTQRAKRVVLALSSMEGRGVARKGLRVAVGKKRRAMIAGVLMSASAANACWMIEGILAVVVKIREALWCCELGVGESAYPVDRHNRLTEVNKPPRFNRASRHQFDN